MRRLILCVAVAAVGTACDTPPHASGPSGDSASAAASATPPTTAGASAVATASAAATSPDDVKIGPDSWQKGELVTVTQTVTLVVGDPETNERETKRSRSVVRYVIDEVAEGKPVLATAQVMEFASSEAASRDPTGKVGLHPTLGSKSIIVDARSGEELVQVQGGGDVPDGVTIAMPSYGGKGGSAKDLAKNLGTGVAQLSEPDAHAATVKFLGVAGEGDARVASVEASFKKGDRAQTTTIARRVRDGRLTRFAMVGDYAALGSMRSETTYVYGRPE